MPGGAGPGEERRVPALPESELRPAVGGGGEALHLLSAGTPARRSGGAAPGHGPVGRDGVRRVQAGGGQAHLQGGGGAAHAPPGAGGRAHRRRGAAALLPGAGGPRGGRDGGQPGVGGGHRRELSGRDRRPQGASGGAGAAGPGPAAVQPDRHPAPGSVQHRLADSAGPPASGPPALRPGLDPPPGGAGAAGDGGERAQRG